MNSQQLEKKIKETLKEINLSKNEKILVALSGGKDSAVTASVLRKLGYDIKGFYVNLGLGDYSKKCEKYAKELCKNINIELFIYNIKKEQGKTIKDFWKKTKKQNLNNCVICGIVKKEILNRQAKKLKVNKIATGHHLNDEVTTVLMNIFKGSPKLSANSGPITKNYEIKKKDFVGRIKPLFYINEDEIKKYAIKNKIPFLKEICPYRENPYRLQVKKFVDKLTKKSRKNMIENLKKIQPQLNKIENEKMQYCKICGEPCRNIICKKCELLK